uniref:Uncharacterized protein n=1 Tax=Leersia perrieri TaxID=77586 RepID=A0A0D9VXT2_9ORYZ
MARKRRRSGAARRPLAERPYTYGREEHIVRNRSSLLDAINGFYAAALDRLPVEEMPSLIPRLLKAGLCAGFSDPVSNIIVNTVSYMSRLPDRKPIGETAARRRRKAALSQIVADTSNVSSYPPKHRRLREMRIPVKSLESLVAFLVSCFPYLPTWEALQYLRLAKADLLAAVRLVKEDRNSNTFSFASRTTKTAIRCATLAAWHPKPERFVTRSYSLASQMEPICRILATEGRLSCVDVENLHGLLVRRAGYPDYAGVTAPQFLRKKIKQLPFVNTKSLKHVLVDKIYRLYLQVLALLSREDLQQQQRYHRGLLKAGHCYGPLMNPAHNIVLNMVWYDTMFPAEEELKTGMMICSRSLVYVASRSLRGLVAYLRACFGTVSKYQAIRYLILAEINLWGAIEIARQEGHTIKNKFDREIGFKTAATAANHPDRDALVNFYVSTVPSMHLAEMAQPLPLKPCGSFDVQLLSLMLSQEPLPIVQLRQFQYFPRGRPDFEAERTFISRKVHAALKKYTERTNGPEYVLHVICGLNPYVVKSGVSPTHYGSRSVKLRYKSMYCHVNFLASPRGLHSSSEVPTLFFAECYSDSDTIDEQLCWPVTGHPGRCFHCEYEGVKVVHPGRKKYHGRDIDFEEMACDKSNGIINEDLVNSAKHVTYSVCISQEDCIYFDFHRDVKSARPWCRDNPMRVVRRNRSTLLASIKGFYAAALDRLPVKAMPALVPRGPASSRLASASASWTPALSRIAVDTSNVVVWRARYCLLRDMSIAVRSLEALVEFLTSYFPYPGTYDALEYLRLENADLFAAVRLIEHDRGTGAASSFSFASLTTETALTCAALAGWHPNPKSLVERSCSLASHMGEASRLLSIEGCLSCKAVKKINRLVKRRREPADLVGVALPRSLEIKDNQPPFVVAKSLKSILLHKIYGFYLDALAILPMYELRKRYHRGLLKAGHCYGPFENPVHNIVLNTVWYDTMFPPQEEVSVQMICSRSLVRAAFRSLRGLVAYLCACFCTISEDQAVCYLN